MKKTYMHELPRGQHQEVAAWVAKLPQELQDQLHAAANEFNWSPEFLAYICVRESLEFVKANYEGRFE